MKFKEFGTVVEEKPKQFKEFGTVVEEKAGPSRTRSLISAPIKGAVKGALDIASFVDPVKAILGAGPVPGEIQEMALQTLLPTQELPLEKGLERAGRIGVSAVGGPGGALAKGIRTAAGAGLGQLAEEMGAPEWGQHLAELSAFISPKFGKELLPKKSQKEAVEFLRSKGLTDREITPLLKSERTIRTLSRLSEKGKKTEKLTSGIHSKLGESYDVLKDKFQGLKEPFLKGNTAVEFDDALQKSIDKISPRFRRLISEDLSALRNQGITGENLINFYQDINQTIKGQKGGNAVLGMLKKPIMDGLNKLNPELAKDFTKLNEFYGKKAVLAKALKPDMIDNLFSRGKVYAILGALASAFTTGNLGFLKALAAKEIGTRIFREMLTNPRLQNLSTQMVKSITENNIPAALRTYEIFKNELSKKDPKGAKSLDLFEKREDHRNQNSP